MSATSKQATWTGRILAVLAAVAFVPSGVMKVMHHPVVVEGFGRSNIPEGAILILGIVELTCITLYLIPRTVVLGTLLVTGYLGGATLANVINRSDFIHVFVVGLIVWVGAWFRVPELRTLVPFRQTQKT